MPARPDDDDDDLPDDGEDDFGEEEPKVDTSFKHAIIVDGLPIVPEAKKEKLMNVVRKFFSQVGTIIENGLEMLTRILKMKYALPAVGSLAHQVFGSLVTLLIVSEEDAALQGGADALTGAGAGGGATEGIEPGLAEVGILPIAKTHHQPGLLPWR